MDIQALCRSGQGGDAGRLPRAHIFGAASWGERAHPEIEKLGAGVRGDTVTAQDVERMALRRPEARIFDMTDSLAARDY